MASSVHCPFQTPWWGLGAGNRPQRQTPPVYPYQKGLCYWIGGTHGSLELPKVKAWMSEAERSWWNPLIYKKDTIEPKSEPLLNQLHNFLSVIKGKDAPVCSGKGGLRTLSVIEAIKKSARKGKVIKPFAVLS